jgi:hypothetical protein
MSVIGYKVFNPDFTCRDFQYKEGEAYEITGKLEICRKGFHFCKIAADCFNYYQFNPDNIVCLVEATGEVVEEGDKCVTDKIVIKERISWERLLTIVNTGKGNSGYSNSGHSNSGDWNSGHRNSGDSNSGDSNSGDSNSGDSNSGHRNSGDSNSGDSNSGHRNSGDSNSGDSNSGDWNSTRHSSGVFNSEEAKILMFNKPSGWTYNDWRRSEANDVLSGLVLSEWIWWDNMTDEEKKQYPKAFVTDGYLKRHDYKTACATMWAKLSDIEKQHVYDLPNFDAEVFFQITGIQTKQSVCQE